MKIPFKIQINELQEEFSKPHTEKEYELLHKKHKRLLAIDFLKGCIIPFISLIFSIIVLIMKCKTG